MSTSDDRFQRLQAISAALDPLIDYCLALGIHSPEFEAGLRVAFVKRAEQVLPVDKRTNGKPSHRTIGLATGLARNEVQQILASGDAASPQRMQLKAQKRVTSEKILAIWEKKPRYRSNSGAPLDLPLDPHEDGPSFTELVGEALPGKPARHVLKELRRRGLVQQLADEIIRYNARSTTTIASPDKTKALHYAAEQQKLLGDTLFHNVGPSKAPNDFRAYTASIPIEVPIDELPVIRAAVIRRMDVFTRMFEREYGRATKKKKKGAKTTKSMKKIPTVTVGLGVFTWQKKSGRA